MSGGVLFDYTWPNLQEADGKWHDHELAELKPCPFCGGEAIHGDEHGEPMIRVNHKRGCFLGTLAICNNDEAVEAWNRRDGERDE